MVSVPIWTMFKIQILRTGFTESASLIVINNPDWVSYTLIITVYVYGHNHVAKSEGMLVSPASGACL